MLPRTWSFLSKKKKEKHQGIAIELTTFHRQITPWVTCCNLYFAINSAYLQVLYFLCHTAWLYYYILHGCIITYCMVVLLHVAWLYYYILHGCIITYCMVVLLHIAWLYYYILHGCIITYCMVVLLHTAWLYYYILHGCIITYCMVVSLHIAWLYYYILHGCIITYCMVVCIHPVLSWQVSLYLASELRLCCVQTKFQTLNIRNINRTQQKWSKQCTDQFTDQLSIHSICWVTLTTTTVDKFPKWPGLHYSIT